MTRITRASHFKGQAGVKDVFVWSLSMPYAWGVKCVLGNMSITSLCPLSLKENPSSINSNVGQLHFANSISLLDIALPRLFFILTLDTHSPCVRTP